MILLDTQVVYWSMVEPERLGRRARSLIASTPSRFVSSITHVEFAIKQMKGKLHVPADLPASLAAAGFEALAFSDAHAQGIRDLPTLAGHDPFDRMLLAQAHVGGLSLVTSDRHLLEFAGTVDATQ